MKFFLNCLVFSYLFVPMVATATEQPFIPLTNHDVTISATSGFLQQNNTEETLLAVVEKMEEEAYTTNDFLQRSNTLPTNIFSLSQTAWTDKIQSSNYFPNLGYQLIQKTNKNNGESLAVEVNALTNPLANKSISQAVYFVESLEKQTTFTNYLNQSNKFANIIDNEINWQKVGTITLLDSFGRFMSQQVSLSFAGNGKWIFLPRGTMVQLLKYMNMRIIPSTASRLSQPLSYLLTVEAIPSLVKISSITTLSRLNYLLLFSLGSQISNAIIANALVGYGQYFLLGYGDLKTVNRYMTASTVGVTTGLLLGTAAEFLVLNYATVSAVTAGYGLLGTGVMTKLYSIFGASVVNGVSGWLGPISVSSLSNVSATAASKASMAWFGGGAFAGGGLGASSGALVMTGSMVVVSVAVGAGIYYLYTLSDENTERERVQYLLNRISASLEL